MAPFGRETSFFTEQFYSKRVMKPTDIGNNSNFEKQGNRFYGVVASTLDSESKDPSSNLGRTYFWKKNWKNILNNSSEQRYKKWGKKSRSQISKPRGEKPREKTIILKARFCLLAPFGRETSVFTEKFFSKRVIKPTDIGNNSNFEKQGNRFFGVVASTLDSQSKDPSSNLGRSYFWSISFEKMFWKIPVNKSTENGKKVSISN